MWNLILPYFKLTLNKKKLKIDLNLYIWMVYRMQV